MNYDSTNSTHTRTVRTLSQQEELPLLRDHLLRLDRTSRHDRFHGFMDDSFIRQYAERCANDGTVIIAYFEDGVVRGAAELHPPEQSPDSQPEIAFSVEASARRKGVGSILFKKLIAEAHARGYRALRITTGAQNEAMRTLANKFGAKLTFHHGEFDRQHRPGAAQGAHPGAGAGRECGPARSRPRDRELQPRLLADGDADVWLESRGLKRALHGRQFGCSELPANFLSAGALVVAKTPDDAPLDHDRALRALLAGDHPGS